MGSCNPAAIPMEPRLKLSEGSKCTLTHATFYSSIVGCQRYLVHTHPYIAFVIGYVIRFMKPLR
jgi:hypothetical protein